MIFTRKAFEREIDKRMHEEYIRRMQDERLERLEKRVAELELTMYDVRMKADPEFCRRNTPTCGCDMEAK